VALSANRPAFEDEEEAPAAEVGGGVDSIGWSGFSSSALSDVVFTLLLCDRRQSTAMILLK